MSHQRILIVEDNDALSAIMRDILQEEGFEVDAAADAIEALEAMERAKPDLIASDIMMPGTDGYGLYERVCARPEWVAIPFIFVTGRSERDDVLKGKCLGVEDYITKPFTREDLVTAVRARLKRAQTIREAMENEFDQLKREITTVLAHELRTPLTWILGYSELGLEAIASLSPEELKEYLIGINNGTLRLHRIVEDLQLLVELDMGQAAEVYSRHAQLRDDLGAIIENAVARFEGEAENRGRAVKLELSSALPLVSLHEPFFVDALGRLLDNAAKFSRGKGQLVTVYARQVPAWVEVAVVDQGVGMSADELAHLFEHFRQFNRQKTEQQGVGLGLAIARGLIRLHGGNIRAKSVPGRGSVFTVQLPKATAARSEPYQRSAQVLSRTAEDILPYRLNR